MIKQNNGRQQAFGIFALLSASSKKSVFRHLSVTLVFAVASASYAGEPEKSCANIKDYIAFELATNIRSVCAKSNVDMPRSKLRSTFNSMLSEEEASPATCAADCEVLSAMKGITIQECIDNIQVGQFVNTFMEKGVFNNDTCTDMKNRME